jgi:MFS family permease
MTDALTLLALFMLGAGLGWWLRGRTSGARKRVLIGIAAVFGAPVVVFVVANVVDSPSLAMIAGLSLMMLVAAAVPVALGFVVGTILAGRSRGVAQPAPSQPIQPIQLVVGNPPLAPAAVSAQRRGLLIAIAGVGAGFWVMLALGFRLHDQPIPEELETGLLPAAVVFIAAVALGVRALWQRRRKRIQLAGRDIVAEHNARVAAYQRDPLAIVCCRHLAPIESAMRGAGVRVEPSGIKAAAAHCCIDMERLAQRFALPASVTYDEVYSPDRSELDPPHATLCCSACESRLWLVHAGAATPATPTFPAE